MALKFFFRLIRDVDFSAYDYISLAVVVLFRSVKNFDTYNLVCL
ncbi:hypothetical protein [uncultured Gammaproteobacteria bacterium]|uniref:Uncharacterized protein n=1 Tax=Bathymodiolus azoricus thioautotrophic gill symbiont TaxID=235205 RepID=A0A1H6M141_9GAMM|nr:hypothetical protein [uncultured Gammaproteobacteria bacterium]CAC9519863.1 hypothetical protein [uncultured Gammaproteobacteria bacterium]CAC9999719.1 hypothetical protein [uncultured Gammaproteobacteria bacterium]SEH92518.1 hypothetical protein BAZSYMA_ACONTIG00157_7 [Bathymodiolus azoricus thioautotrophic gill symbiont]VVH54834.1 hypothetical protein BAZOLSSOX_2076 [uncultured Gammaproteobacteria bacterium]